MKHYIRMRIKLGFMVGAAIAVFMLGRYSAHSAVQRIPMASDQLTIGMGMVKATLEVAVKNEEEMIRVARNWDMNRLTRTQANERLQGIIDGQEAQVETAVMQHLSRNINFKKGDTAVPSTDYSEEMYNMIEYVQTKFPNFFKRYGD